MAKYRCKICGDIYDEEIEKVKFSDLPDDWKCPKCFAPKSLFELVEEVEEEIEEVVEDPNYSKRVYIDDTSYSIKRDENKCILCGNCKSVCEFKQGVYNCYDMNRTYKKMICIDCGQCSVACPTGAISIKEDYNEVRKILKEKEKIVIFQTSPSIRVSFGELFDMEAGTLVEGKIVSLLRKLGASYVFDTTFGADLTIMEEASELIDRIKNKKTLPMFTSCCPAWVKFVEMFYPKYINNLSTCKSPILMEGAIIKTYVANKLNIDPKNIVNVAITPCTAKKAEIKREEINGSSKYNNIDNIKDVDYVITVRELASWIKEEKIDFNNIIESEYDSILPKGTGAGLIFGNTGGVMEAALRTANYLLTNEDIKEIEFNSIRGLSGIKEADIKINDLNLKVAVISGTKNARKILKQIEENNIKYDFIEVMACPGGCIAGGGQPKHDLMILDEIKEKRIKTLYNEDLNSEIRYSYKNPVIKEIYKDFLINPLSDISKQLLHTTYKNKENLLNKEKELV